MNTDSDAFDIMSLDAQLLTPEQMSELIQQSIRSAHAKRSRALARMCVSAGSWLKQVASALVSRSEAPPAGGFTAPTRA